MLRWVPNNYDVTSDPEGIIKGGFASQDALLDKQYQSARNAIDSIPGYSQIGGFETLKDFNKYGEMSTDELTDDLVANGYIPDETKAKVHTKNQIRSIASKYGVPQGVAALAFRNSILTDDIYNNWFIRNTDITSGLTSEDSKISDFFKVYNSMDGATKATLLSDAQKASLLDSAKKSYSTTRENSLKGLSDNLSRYSNLQNSTLTDDPFSVLVGGVIHNNQNVYLNNLYRAANTYESALASMDPNVLQAFIEQANSFNKKPGTPEEVVQKDLEKEAQNNALTEAGRMINSSDPDAGAMSGIASANASLTPAEQLLKEHLDVRRQKDRAIRNAGLDGDPYKYAALMRGKAPYDGTMEQLQRMADKGQEINDAAAAAGIKANEFDNSDLQKFLSEFNTLTNREEDIRARGQGLIDASENADNVLSSALSGSGTISDRVRKTLFDGDINPGEYNNSFLSSKDINQRLRAAAGAIYKNRKVADSAMQNAKKVFADKYAKATSLKERERLVQAVQTNPEYFFNKQEYFFNKRK